MDFCNYFGFLKLLEFWNYLEILELFWNFGNRFGILEIDLAFIQFNYIRTLVNAFSPLRTGQTMFVTYMLVSVIIRVFGIQVFRNSGFLKFRFFGIRIFWNSNFLDFGFMEFGFWNSDFWNSDFWNLDFLNLGFWDLEFWNLGF